MTSTNEDPMRMRTIIPTNKVMAGSVGPAAATFIVWLLNSQILSEPIPQPVEVAIATLMVFIFGYVVPPNQNDILR